MTEALRTASTAAKPWQNWMKLPSPATLHLLNRLSYGPSASAVASIRFKTDGGWLTQQLNPASIPDPYCDRLLGDFQYLNQTPSQVHAAIGDGGWAAMEELAIAHLTRAVWSERQLFEVMVDVWSNHFNVTCPSSEVWDNRTHLDAAVFRKHALGRFSDLLIGVTTHPAMLSYLGNDSSTAANPNENLGRELLELHTVGVQAGYTEADVRQSSLLLTGLSKDWRTGEFSYRSGNRHVGRLTVMGFSDANGSAGNGVAVVKRYLGYLAMHPATATMVATKLARRFVSDAPSAALISALAKTYLANNTAIVPVLRQLFGSSEFRSSAGVKVRRPFEQLAATLRAIGAKPPAGSGMQTLRELYWASGGLGQPPLGWHPPNGYPDVAAAWQSPAGMLAVWNFQHSVVKSWWPILAVPAEADYFPATPPPTAGALVNAVAVKLLHTPLPADQANAICRFLQLDPAQPVPAESALNWRRLDLVALVLASPIHLRR